MSLVSTVGRMGMAALQSALGELPRNDRAWSYVIGTGGVPYITRTLLPRVAGRRPMLHRIHRPDADAHLHNHPWRTCRSFILSGGYTEERLVDGEVVQPECHGVERLQALHLVVADLLQVLGARHVVRLREHVDSFGGVVRDDVVDLAVLDPEDVEAHHFVLHDVPNSSSIAAAGSRKQSQPSGTNGWPSPKIP